MVKTSYQVIKTMNSIITKYGSYRLSLTCDKDKVKQIVNGLISQFDDTFTFTQLCSAVLVKAEEENLLNKEPNTLYRGSIELSFNDLDSINLIVWEMIWKKLIVIVLYENPYRPIKGGDFLLRKVN